MKKKILFFDDEERFAERWAKRLESLATVKRNFDVHHLTMADFGQAKDELNERRKRARNGNQGNEPDWNSQLDNVAILIIDFDLFKFSQDVTGEAIAYLARCYSRCGLIIALNQFSRKPNFDLTLKGHPESYADLNLHDSQIHNQGLWKEPWKGFRPWVWPLLPQAIEKHENRVKEVRHALDEPIFGFLGLDRISHLMPRSTVEFIESKGRKPEETTFRQLVEGSNQGLQARDKPLDDESIARIAAVRVHKWIERLVLPGQDILVDAPHLISRFPSLLKGNPKERKVWNRIMSLGMPDEQFMHTDLIEKFRFQKDNWVSRPCWFWGDLSSYEGITEVKDPWTTTKKVDVVFCEDIATFELRSKTTEFVADLSSPFVRRYVRREANMDYQPLVRFAI
ncbi:MAG: hypothetical protein Q8K00_03390 [Syntrophales bacterium]|nr:hypothetical protein [Syntrophales bacterium]